MKILCDVCSKGEASLFCVADEAALCIACDHRVHHANKLAGKHQRFSLLQPSAKQIPICDICQERRAFFFCQQDRAVLCRECDVCIHKTNEHTQKHTRFLLTGVKLSATSALYSSSESSANNKISDTVPDMKSQVHSTNKQVSVSSTNLPLSAKATTSTATGTISAAPAPPPPAPAKVGESLESSSTSSISEYLIDMLPGWHVEDFLDSSSPYGFCKTGGNDAMPFWDAELDNNLNGFSPEKMGFWVPQASPLLHQPQIQAYPSSNIAFGSSNGFKKEATNIKSSRKWTDDNSFAVPQICTPSAAKRSRNFS